MDNASEALKMAGQYLLFIMALSVCIASLGQLREVSQTLFENSDREYVNSYAQDLAYVEDRGILERIVGVENIIPSIYKAYKENYKVVFPDIILYRKGTSIDMQGKDVHTIDLGKDITGNDELKEQFLKSLLFGATTDEKNKYRRNDFIYFNDDTARWFNRRII